MSQTSIPEEIQILLDCLSSREDLELAEMKPLRDWMYDTPDGELMVAIALAQDKQIKSALEELEIPIPKQLLRKVHSYIGQNAPETVQQEAMRKQEELEEHQSYTRKPFYKSNGVQYCMGLLAGLAAMFLVVTSIIYIVICMTYVNENHVAKLSRDWFDRALSVNDTWQSDIETPLKMNRIQLPPEIKQRPYQWKQFTTNYGPTLVFEFKPVNMKERAMLFMFEVEQRCKLTTLSTVAQFQFPDRKMCVGVAKQESSTHAYALAVEGAPTRFAEFVSPEAKNVGGVGELAWKFNYSNESDDSKPPESVSFATSF